MTERSIWEAAPLSEDDQRLISTYEEVGRPVDKLPYTKDFDELIKRLGRENNDDEKRTVFQRLLYLRKTARLPRVYS